MADHPITPPPELMAQWSDAWYQAQVKPVSHVEFVATQAARWAADQELDACAKWLSMSCWSEPAKDIRAARRPKPSSLKEQALEQLRSLQQCGAGHRDTDKILLALEALPE